jgi:hypothetical protein
MAEDETAAGPRVTGVTAQDIYDSKAARRRRLANLSIDERVKLIEKLRDAGRALIEARKTLPSTSKSFRWMNSCTRRCKIFS